VETKKMLDLVYKSYLPITTVLVQDKNEEMEKKNLYATWKESIDGRSTAYLCRNFTCEQGITSIEYFQEKLMNKD
jgi:uncharacterized protein YyaL (SSP411 family)